MPDLTDQSQKKARERAKQAHSVTHFYYVLCGFSRPFAYMPDYDRSGCAVVVETVLRILHTDERQATYTYDSPLAHPYLSCEYFTEFHAVSRLAEFLDFGLVRAGEAAHGIPRAWSACAEDA